MAVKYIFVTGGVVSGLGKGITAASLGRLLKERGYKVTIQKFDPYINVDPGTMSPYQHGEVFVTDDGAETDLDVGHYERFIDENLSIDSNITSGKIYWTVLNKERDGKYNGGTVQVIPHITNEIQERIKKVAKSGGSDIVITEIGGTIGDIESLPFIEAIRQHSVEVGRENVLFIHVTLIPYLVASKELKSKPTQHSVKELRSLGIQPDILVCRSEHPIPEDMKSKLSLFCDVRTKDVIQNLTESTLYEVPLSMEKEGLADITCEHLGLKNNPPTLDEWKAMVEKIKNLKHNIKIGLVGKYVELHDAYLSAAESLRHGGFENNTDIEISFIDSEKITETNVVETLSGYSGIVVPGGFGERGTNGKILAAKYARENKVPFLGISLGMQMAAIEFARNVLKIDDAHSSEFGEVKNPVIHLNEYFEENLYIHKDRDLAEKKGPMRLGSYPCDLMEGSKVREIYNKDRINERHRHRYEFNNQYKEVFEKNGVVFSGKSPDGKYLEILELKDHPWFIGVQFHPEFLSRPNKPHPLFSSFVKACLDFKD